MTINTLALWHNIIETGDMTQLDIILADDCVFHSPVVHTPQEGKAKSKMYLATALSGLSNDFCYVREVVNENHAVLEFKTKVGDIEINGIDMFSWNEEGKIVDFKVMIRPLKAINIIHKFMASGLESYEKK